MSANLYIGRYYVEELAHNSRLFNALDQFMMDIENTNKEYTVQQFVNARNVFASHWMLTVARVVTKDTEFSTVGFTFSFHGHRYSVIMDTVSNEDMANYKLFDVVDKLNEGHYGLEKAQFIGTKTAVNYPDDGRTSVMHLFKESTKTIRDIAFFFGKEEATV